MMLTKYTKLIGLVALLVFLCHSCKDDENCTPDTPCENFPSIDGPSIEGPIIQKVNQRKAPCFNPRNSNEFIYLKIEHDVQALVKSNLETAEETILIENVNIIGQPDWNTFNAIIYSANDQQVYLLDDWSLSPKRLTNYFWNNNPKFFQDTLILFSVGSESVPGASGLKMINFNGDRIDSTSAAKYGTVFGLMSTADSLIYGEFSIDGKYGIYSLDFPTKAASIKYGEIFDGLNQITGVCVDKKNKNIYYSTYRTGVFRIDNVSNSRIQIKSACDTHSYRHLSVSPDGTRLLAERVDGTNFNQENGGWTEESKIVIMNIDGSDERVLFE